MITSDEYDQCKASIWYKQSSTYPLFNRNESSLLRCRRWKLSRKRSSALPFYWDTFSEARNICSSMSMHNHRSSLIIFRGLWEVAGEVGAHSKTKNGKSHWPPPVYLYPWRNYSNISFMVLAGSWDLHCHQMIILWTNQWNISVWSISTRQHMCIISMEENNEFDDQVDWVLYGDSCSRYFCS